jgi:thiol-disulfide isomerase/thioredoxin
VKHLFRPAALTAVLLLMAACGSNASSAVPVSGGGPVASFLKESKLEGQVVLVEFGTIGCELSNSGLDAMIDLQKRNAVPGLAFARLEPIPDAKAFDEYYQKKASPFPVVRDTAMAVAKALGTTIYPQFALLDKFGRVRYRGTQPAEKDLGDWVKALTAEAKDPGPDAPMFGNSRLDAAALLVSTKLPDLSDAVRPLADLKGKSGMLLGFVDTKCPFSNVAIREFPKVASALQAKGIASLLVNIGEPATEVKKAYAPGSAVVYDTGKVTQKCWNVQSVPTLFLLDSTGAVAYQGGAVWAGVAAALRMR